MNVSEKVNSINVKQYNGGRALMVAYYFPPLSGSGVFRSIKFAKYLSLFNWQPTVISTDRPHIDWNFSDKTQVAEIPQDVKVIRLHDNFNEERIKGCSQERINSILNFFFNVIRDDEEAAKIFLKMVKTREGFLQLLVFPCSALFWAHDVVNYISSNINIHEFDVVYTTSGPYSAHLIGYYLNKKYGIPWVADYRDQWTDNAYPRYTDPNSALYKLQFHLEKVLLHQATCNITVVEEAVQMYVDHFDLPKEKIVSITNGYDEADFERYPIRLPQTRKFTINYSGLLYVAGQSIEPVLQALQQLFAENAIDKNDVQFRIVGGSSIEINTALARKYDLESIMVQVGYVSHQDAILSNIDSNILFLLIGDEEKHKIVYAGKFFDYLRSGKPILAIAPPGGVVDRVLKETGHGKVFIKAQIEDIKNMILEEYVKWKNNDFVDRLYSPEIKKFERKILTGQLAQIFEKVTAPPPM